MKFNLRTLAFAAAALLSGGAQADINQPSAPGGNATLLFVAIDANTNIAFVADIGLTISDFTDSTAFTSGLAAPVTWNFSTNATNSGIAGTNAWDAAYSTFASTQTGGDFQWGVIAGDNVSSTTTAPASRNLLATGNATVAQMTNVVSNSVTGVGTGNTLNWYAATNNFGNLATASTNGAAALTSANGEAYIGNDGSLGNNFNGVLTWSYLLDNGVASTFQRQRALADPTVTQFGNPNTVDSLSASPITFTFDIATNTLVLAPAIPEPGTYALLLAGLGAVGFIARRRKV